MMVVWIKCYECTHFVCEKTDRFSCEAFLPQHGVPSEIYAKPLDRVCSGEFKFEQTDDETIKKRAKRGFANVFASRKKM